MTIFHSKSDQIQAPLIGVGVFLSTLILYLLTAYPTVAYIDSGELAVVNGTLGIAHPTGYPLYTIIGRVFSLLPLELIKSQILLGALCTSTAVMLLAMALLRLFKSEALLQRIIVGLTCIVFGIAPLIWSQGVTNEVYSLHLLMLVIILSLLLKPYSGRNLIIGAVVVGLSFGNHMSTILLIPAVGYYLFTNSKKLRSTPRPLWIAVGAVVVAASLYLYLPIRSAQDPIFNWGHPTSWENFVRHVTGWQYHVWMFSRSASELLKSLSEFGVIFFRQFPAPYWLAIVYGIIVGWRKHHFVAMLLTTVMVFNVLYALNFTIPDIDNYLLPSVTVLFVFSVIGINAFVTERKRFVAATAGIVAALIVWGLFANWSENDQSKNTSALDELHNYYASVDSSALVFSSEWDAVSPWLYSHFYLGERPDVVLIDNELARRSWYPGWIRHADEGLAEFIKPEVEAFLPHVRLFEAGLKYDQRQIEGTYRGMLMKMMRYPRRKFYYDQSVQLSFPPPGQFFIDGQLMRVVREGEVQSDSVRITQAPNFGKPDDALSEREQMHLRRYNLMIELGKKQADDSNKPGSVPTE
jgi:hypothetical protein